jgi:hypothetical protein
MKILEALDLGLDGIDLRVWLDTAKTIVGPSGDVQPDPAFVWRTIVPAGQFDDPLAAMPRILALAEAELRRRQPRRMEALSGLDLREPRA